MAGLQTEYDFILPKGFVDSDGNLHRKGTMRLATAMDEIMPLRDPRVRENQAYLSIILLARVITRLGTLGGSDITTGVVERLFSSDLAYLQGLYNRINATTFDGTVCPTCGRAFGEAEQEAAPVAGLGDRSYPSTQLHEEVAYIAYYFHWPLDQIMQLEHADRRRWVEEISAINDRLNGPVEVEVL